jgi:hypothetical protein
VLVVARLGFAVGAVVVTGLFGAGGRRYGSGGGAAVRPPAAGLDGAELSLPRSSATEGLGDDAGLRSAKVEAVGVDAGLRDVAVVEFCGSRTVFAGVVPAGGPLRVCTLTARAADPVRRTPAAVDQAATGSTYNSRPEIAAALTGQINAGQRYSQTLGLDLLYVAVPVLSGEKISGVVRLTYPASVVTEQVNGQLRTIWTVAGTTVLLAGILAYVMAGAVTRRLLPSRSSTI